MYVVFTEKDIEKVPPNSMFITIGKIVDIVSRKNYFILKISLIDSIKNFYYFKESPNLYSTVLVIGRKVKKGDITFLRALYAIELSIKEEIYWRYILLDNYKISFKQHSPNIVSTKNMENSIIKSNVTKNQDRKAETNNLSAKSNDKYVLEDKIIDTSLKYNEISGNSEFLDLELDIDTSDKNSLIKAIITIVSKLDKGEGVPINDIEKYINIQKDILEEIISELLMIGELYEYKPGRLKLLK